MIYIEAKSKNPYVNLALEEYVFEKMDKARDYFILWQNSNTIVVGKNQNTVEEINQQFVDEHGIQVVRRMTGGGAVYHDEGNLNFTYVVDQTNDNLFDFELFAAPVIRALEKLGIKAEFTGRNDILIDGKKISGSSQYVRNGRVLNHGCIMLDSNLDRVSGALRTKKARFDSKSVKSVRSRVTTINDHLKKPITIEELKRRLLDEISKSAPLESYELTQRDYDAIWMLENRKYSTWEWNYGKSYPYRYKKGCRYDFGTVSIQADIEEGKIKGIRIYGDFFGSRDIRELEEALLGEKLDENLDVRLGKKIEVSSYIHGMTVGMMKELLWY